MTRPLLGVRVSNTHRAAAFDQAALTVGAYVVGPVLVLLSILLLVDRTVRPS